MVCVVTKKAWENNKLFYLEEEFLLRLFNAQSVLNLMTLPCFSYSL